MLSNAKLLKGVKSYSRGQLYTMRPTDRPSNAIGFC